MLEEEFQAQAEKVALTEQELYTKWQSDNCQQTFEEFKKTYNGADLVESSNSGIMSFKFQLREESNDSGVFVKSKKKKKQQQPGKKKEKKKAVIRTELPKPKGIGYVSHSALQSMKFDYSKDKYIKPNGNPVLSIQFIGHVDAGKSTLCGHLARLLSPSSESFQNNTNKLSHYFDSFPEEQQQGKTQEPVYECFELENRRIVVIDNPGHKGFVPRVLQYSQAADVVCLIISTKINEFESGFEKEGQTREHFQGAIGVQSGQCGVIIVANKMDIHSWNEEIYDKVAKKVQDWMQKDLNVKAQLCPVSAINGTNLLDGTDVPGWYQGIPLVQMLSNIPLPIRNYDAFLRIPIVDVLKDQGIFAFGKVESGLVLISYSQFTFTNCTRLGFDDYALQNNYNYFPYALAGEYVKLKIKNASENELKQGFIICNIEDLCRLFQFLIESLFKDVTYEIEAELNITDLPEHKPILSGGYRCILHIHTIVEEVEIKMVISFKNSQNEFISQSFLRPGMTGKVRITVLRVNNIYVWKNMKQIPIQEVLHFAMNPSLLTIQKFIYSRTIGFGKILRLKPTQKLPPIQEPQQEQFIQTPSPVQDQLQSIKEEDDDN